MSDVLKRKIQNHDARIALVGLGYVGLPLAISFARAGYKVFGLDMDKDRVGKLNRKESYILDVPPSEIAAVVDSGKFEASTHFDALAHSDVVIICVPTPLKRKYTPDISYMVSAVNTIARFIRKDMLIVLESTTYPGTTRELIQPALEKSGLKAEKDFYLSFSPERIDPGNPHFDVTKITKVVGGLSHTSGELTKLLYEKIITKVHMVSSTDAAEMTKLLENTFRIINIGWINEIAMMCHKMNIDIWEVIEAAKTKPFGFMPFYPGLGVGGHCIPDDPLYLYWKAKHHGFSSKFIKLSADTNSAMPQYAVTRLREILKKNKKLLNKSKVLVLGVTYKKDVKDLRKSPPLKLIELLKSARCRVSYFDPYIPYLNINGIKMDSIRFDAKTLLSFDCAVIATDHSKVDYNFLLENSKVIFDIRNVYKGVNNPKIVKL